MNIFQIILICLNIILITTVCILLNKKNINENFNESIDPSIAQSIKNLSKISDDLTKDGHLTIPGDLIIEGKVIMNDDLDVKGDFKVLHSDGTETTIKYDEKMKKGGLTTNMVRAQDINAKGEISADKNIHANEYKINGHDKCVFNYKTLHFFNESGISSSDYGYTHDDLEIKAAPGKEEAYIQVQDAIVMRNGHNITSRND